MKRTYGRPNSRRLVSEELAKRNAKLSAPQKQDQADVLGLVFKTVLSDSVVHKCCVTLMKLILPNHVGSGLINRCSRRPPTREVGDA